ncbi:glial cell line-derived neurotrophic factor-like isoform X1 [Echeneis naucrates]|uniref:Glial cell line-derived neurotrophic factor n=1 Tax=Echeneis naucrates TaxID=173247 RepID=A0A665UIC0_ECHNA|nr:glial cell line-derived neurotrophic factor-like isoform X1 [Echeneis naucrates]
MKLWDSLTACLILLSAVRAGPLFHGGRRAAESPLELPPVRHRLSAASPGGSRSQTDTAGREGPLSGAGKYNVDEPLPSEVEEVVDLIRVTISRIRRSSSSTVSISTSLSSTSPPSREKLGSSTQYRRERKKGASQQRAKGGSGGAGVGETGRKVRGGGGSGRGQGCVLKQIHLNVSDLGLGYRSGEEMIFRYCSGPCRKSETNYDKILSNLAHNRRLPPKDRPSQACCRPTAFDDDLSFLDDNLVYHTVRKHSARKCGCV